MHIIISSARLAVLQAVAHEHLGTLLPREKHKHAYEEALKARYRHLPEIHRILRHRHLPVVIYKVRRVAPRRCALGFFRSSQRRCSW